MQLKLPDSIKKLIANLAELPSIGPRQATRLAFYLVGRGGNFLSELTNDFQNLAKLKICERCFFIHENQNGLCEICSSPSRLQNVIMVIEKETDLISLENTGKFKGRYFILGPIPKVGVLTDYQKLRIESLKSFISKDLGGKAEEIILGVNPTSVGDFNASLIVKELGPLAKKMSRLGRGLPTGGEIEFADDDTLGAALEQRN